MLCVLFVDLLYAYKNRANQNTFTHVPGIWGGKIFAFKS